LRAELRDDRREEVGCCLLLGVVEVEVVVCERFGAEGEVGVFDVFDYGGAEDGFAAAGGAVQPEQRVGGAGPVRHFGGAEEPGPSRGLVFAALLVVVGGRVGDVEPGDDFGADLVVLLLLAVLRVFHAGGVEF